MRAPCCNAYQLKLEIIRTFYDGLVPNIKFDQNVEITNFGNEPQQLAGCVLVDISDGYSPFTFPSNALALSKSVRVYTDEYHFGWGDSVSTIGM